jgi:hypothetical protein
MGSFEAAFNREDTLRLSLITRNAGVRAAAQLPLRPEGVVAAAHIIG